MPTLRMSMNEVISLRLQQARTEAGLTQEQAAEKLQPLLGIDKPWSRPTFSQAEQGWEDAKQGRGRMFRQHTADDVLAYSIAFDRPFLFFLVPPDDRTHRVFGNPGANVSKQQLWDSLTNIESVVPLLRPIGKAALTNGIAKAAWAGALGPVPELIDKLRQVTETLEELQALADDAAERQAEEMGR